LIDETLSYGTSHIQAIHTHCDFYGNCSDENKRRSATCRKNAESWITYYPNDDYGLKKYVDFQDFKKS